ncbi:hypothetical protein Mterra_02346 [Calidithermus terrae]|uniref:DUF402 domain-containing protein n=1 Tax=Calidithermus terrae TaxID=1408545 RepID=A0A399EJG9_9DEIN|nr:DUF402 domain-containing protein [Calidithermus terrae]RIH83219.1 hypothetical protein Mterra_02346 [Calidithermus terrae]
MYALGQQLRVEFWKYPEERLHYWWEAEVREVREGAVLLYMPPGFEFHHESKQRVLRVDHQAYVAFFEGRWYSGGPDLDPQGRVLEYYWNVQTPPRFEVGLIRQYDLELDVKCRADHRCQTFDLEEFAAKVNRYPAEWVEQARQAVAEIERHVQQREWPVLPPGEAGDWLERV